MKTSPKKIKDAIINLIPGVADEDADMVIRELQKDSERLIGGRQASRRSAPFLDALANPSEARKWISKADAMHDPDVVLLRQLSERDRSKVLLVAEAVKCSVPWDGVMSKDFLVLPPRSDPHIRSIPVEVLTSSGHRFGTLAAWFARSSLRISIEHRIEPEFAFGFLLLDSLWKGIPPVETSINRFGKASLDARIVIEADPFATEREIVQAFRDARSALGWKPASAQKRERRQRTVALATFFAGMVAEEILDSSAIDWEVALLIWNGQCEVEGRSSWSYVDTISTNPVHLFSRDVKRALESVRGKPTPYVIAPKRNRKLENKFT
jgi:hypothetical protein